VTLRPWYPLVLDKVIANAATETFYRPKDLCETVANQLGLGAQAIPLLNIKLSRVDVYCMPTGSSTDRPAVSLICSSLVPSVGDPATPAAAEVFYGNLKRLSDQGNLSEAAKVSYTWPLHMADIPMNHGVAFNVAAASGNLVNTCVRFHVLWSTCDVATPVTPDEADEQTE